MQLRRVRLDGFGRFNNGLDVTFAAGLNVVLGPNESGKSTLMEGVVAVLFGLPDPVIEALFRPRGVHAAYAGELEFDTDEGRFQVRRDFDSHRVAVQQLHAGGSLTLYQGEANPRGRTDDLNAYLEVVARITGLADREMALRTLFMRQGDLETSVDERVRHMLSGSRTGDYDQVLQRLEEKFFALTRENPWGRRKNKPRDIEELDELIAGLEERRSRASEALVSGGHLSQEIETATEALAQATALAREKSTLVENYAAFFDVNRERSELEKRLKTLREEKEKVKELEVACRRAEAELWPRYEHFRDTGPEFGEQLRNLGNMHREMAGIADDLARRESELAATPAVGGLKRGLLWGGIAAVVTFGAMAGAGAVLLGVAVGLAAGVAAVLIVLFLGKGKERIRMRLEGQVVELEERLEKQKAEVQKAETVLKPMMGDRRYNQVMEEFRDYRERADLLLRYRQILESHRTLAAVEADYEAVFQKLKLADARARDLIAAAPYLAGADEDLDQVAARVEKHTFERDQATAEVDRIQGWLDDLRLRQARQEGASAEDLESVEEELAEHLERRVRLRDARDALREAIEALRDSIVEFQEGHVDRLAARAGEVMKQVTGGGYQRLTLDREFVPGLVSRSGEAFVPSELSQGARDQLHLALRLAVAEEIHPGRCLPILMDDVLVNCDEERLGAIRRILDELIQAGRQVILLTHDPAYLGWGGHNLDLGNASGVTRAALTRGSAPA